MALVRKIIPPTFAHERTNASMNILAKTFVHHENPYAREGNSHGKTLFIYHGWISRNCKNDIGPDPSNPTIPIFKVLIQFIFGLWEIDLRIKIALPFF